MTTDNCRSQALVVQGPQASNSALAAVADAELSTAKRYAIASTAPATRRAYATDWGRFATWCAERELVPLPASTESSVRYLSDLAEQGKKASTIKRAMAAITWRHRMSGLEPPAGEAIKAVMSGIRRTIGVRPERKAPVTVDLVRKLIRLVPGSLIGTRDKALLLVGFAGAFRRSELVALTLQDLERRNEGVILHIRRSKTDQEGEGRTVAIPRNGKLGTLEALEAWIGAAGITAGPIFRAVDRHGRISDASLNDQAVADIVKRYAVRAGLDPEAFAGHSLRSGYVTSALDSGADPLNVMRQTGHRDPRTLKVYDRREAFTKHSGAKFL